MMGGRELPMKLEEVGEEERSRMKVRIVRRNNRLVRSSPGNVYLPYDFVSVANHLYNFNFCDEDILVMTYPKSGTVWMTETLWAMTHIDKIEAMDTMHMNDRRFFLDFDFLLPPIEHEKMPFFKRFQEVCPEGRLEDGVILQLAKATSGRRVFMSHLQLQFFNSSLLENSKVVYVARNPKDACVSYYFFLNQKEDTTIDGDFSDFAESFMKDQLMYSPYWGHLHQAWQLKDHPNLHFVFFEDMKSNVRVELKKLNDFFRLDLTDDQLERVIEATSFQKMSSRESKYPLTKMKGSFFRKGIVGDWKNMASAELDAKMDRWIEENNKDIGLRFRYN